MKSQDLSYRVSEISEHSIESTVAAQKFRIKVFQPIRHVDASERFPVLYVTDADEFFGGLANLASELQLVGETPRFILVGIGYENARAADLLRMRDLFTHSIRARFEAVIEQLARSPIGYGIDDLKLITATTDSSEFLRFIRDELMPFINNHYRTLRNDNSYYGYSAGGTFGLYTLFTQPDTFKRYVLGSPGTSYNGDHFAIQLAKSFIQSGRNLDAQVFISVGELEEFYGQFDLTTGYYLLTKFLNKAAIPNLKLSTRLFLGETHATAWTLAFCHGLKTLLGPAPSVPFWPSFDFG